jgi:hypothetical protein
MATAPIIPEPIQAQMDKTKYYVPSDDDPVTAAAKKAGGIAYQDARDPGAVAILNPQADNLTAVKGHEAYHAMVANMPPTEAAKIPDDDYSDPSKTYDITDAPKWRAQGLTITQIPQEKAARIVERYIKGDTATRAQLQPWIDDLNNIKQSVVQPTRPGMAGINTAVRPPQGVKFAVDDTAAQWKAFTPEQRQMALSRMTPEQKTKLAVKLGYKAPAPVAPTPSFNERLTAPMTPEFQKAHPLISAASDFGGGAINAAEQVVAHPIQSVGGTLQTIGDVGNAVWPQGADPAAVAASRGRLKSQLDFFKAHPAYSAGGLVGGAVAGEGLGEVAGAGARVVPKALQRGTEMITQTGPRETADLVKKTQAENAAQAADRAEELKAHGAKVSAVGKANEAAATVQSRKAALERGVEKLDPEIKSELAATEKAVRAKANAQYNSVRAALEPKPQPVEYVRNGRDTNIEATEAKLPPVKPGFTRLYRSESPTVKFEDVFDKSKLKDYNEGRPPGGKSYTDSLNSADYYRQSYGKDARTTYVDVPNSTAQAANLGSGEYVLSPSTVPSSDLASAVKSAESKIQGSSENLKVFRDILSKHPETEPDTIEYQGAQIPKGHPLYDVLQEQGPAVPPATFSDLQGYYSELGEKLSTGNLPGDVYQAMKTLHSSIGDLMQGMAEKAGVGKQLTGARAFYRDYLNTFRDSKSPIRKALNDAEDKASRHFAGKDKSGIEALARHNPELARKINTTRGYAEEAKGIGKGPAPKPTPTLSPKPTPKTLGPEDVRAAKAESVLNRVDKLRNSSGHFASTLVVLDAIRNAIHGNIGGIATDVGARIAYGAGKQGIASLLEHPSVVRALSQVTDRDIAQIPPEMRSQLGPVVQAARAKGIRVSPALIAAVGAGAASRPYHPTLSPASPVQ